MKRAKLIQITSSAINYTYFRWLQEVNNSITLAPSVGLTRLLLFVFHAHSHVCNLTQYRCGHAQLDTNAACYINISSLICVSVNVQRVEKIFCPDSSIVQNTPRMASILGKVATNLRYGLRTANGKYW